MNLSQLKSLLAVVDTGSFAAAARQLGITQPAVSQHIRKLEESVGVDLIERGSVSVPVKRAIEFIRHARNLLEIAERAQQSLHANELRIGASSNVGTYVIQPLFAEFMKAQGIDGKLVVDTNPAVAEKLYQGEIDVAAMEWWQEEQPAGRRFRNVLWKEEPLILIVGPSHPWAGRKWIRPEALLEQNILGGESGSGTGRVINEGLADIGPHLKISQVLGSTEAVKEGVKAGLGVSMVIRSAVTEELETGSLHEVALRGVALKKGIQLITSASLPETASASRFCHYAMSKVA